MFLNCDFKHNLYMMEFKMAVIKFTVDGNSNLSGHLANEN